MNHEFCNRASVYLDLNWHCHSIRCQGYCSTFFFNQNEIFVIVMQVSLAWSNYFSDAFTRCRQLQWIHMCITINKKELYWNLKLLSKRKLMLLLLNFSLLHLLVIYQKPYGVMIVWAGSQFTLIIFFLINSFLIYMEEIVFLCRNFLWKFFFLCS